MKKNVILPLKLLLLLLFACVCAPSINAQTWTSSFTSGLKQSESEGKPILLFMAYDLDQKLKNYPIFGDKEFRKYAKENLICVKIDLNYNYKTSLYVPRSNSNEKVTEIFSPVYTGLYLYDAKTKKQKVIANFSEGVSGKKSKDLISICDKFKESMGGKNEKGEKGGKK